MHKIYLSLLLTSFTYAQTINFNDALTLTFKNNKDLKKQKLNINLAKVNIENVNALSYGKLSFEEQVNRTNHAGYVFNSKLSSREASFNDFGAIEYIGPNAVTVQPENLNNPKDRNNFNTKLNYDVPLFTGFKLSNQKEILKLQHKANEVKYNLNKRQVSYEVLKAYNSAVVAKEFIQASKKAKESISFIVKSANAFHKEGLITKIDVKQAQVHNLNINAKYLEAQNKFELALAYLKFLTSKNEINDVENLTYIEIEDSNFDNLYKKALENADELKMQNINNKAKKKNIEISKADYYPTIYSHLEYGFNDDKLTLDSQKDYYNAVIGLKYTIFDNTRDIEKQKSQIEYKKSLLDYEKLQEAIKLELKKSLLDLNSKEKILKEKKETLVLANDIYKQSQLMYKNHLIAMTDLLAQEASLRNIQAELIVAKYEKSLALAKINLISGNSFVENNTILKVIK
ncbi:TolC family protein [Poseidonibacter lekithochrous]|uniref:TolC family protein n=1 Tax=Poseidonibacter TaxID=2321187 RepID=UPI001C091A52|nr:MULTISPECIES: TolC family protein [Poseidonibacter]MBU3013613.1 TolC family protein [Poseidonibacter lekithochrous]MDO6826910.1 TolC family protein [Poseidonibacter sp. 1_MG-2023]